VASGFGTYVFAGWTGVGEGSYTGTGNVQSVTMNNPITETASWEQTTMLYTVGAASLIIFLLLILALLLFYADRRRRKKKALAKMQAQTPPTPQ
jgi:flagellar biosynthesis/type III secretory pathway M-ring protein FliF/YscJ